jgi:hypothetical protein
VLKIIIAIRFKYVSALTHTRTYLWLETEIKKISLLPAE